VNASPGPNEYAVDYTKNEILFNEELNGNLPAVQNVNGQGNIPVRVTYFYQTNKRDDLVRATYRTKGLISLSLAVRKYDRASGIAQVLELTDKVKVRNIVK